MLGKSKILFLSSFSFLVLLAFLVGDGVIRPLTGGLFLAGTYLALLGTVFFFHEVPNLGRRLLEAFAVVALFASFYVLPPLMLTALLVAAFVILMPLYLGWRHGVFRGFLHVVLWIALSWALSHVFYAPLPKALWAHVVSAGLSGLSAHYILLRLYSRRTPS